MVDRPGSEPSGSPDAAASGLDVQPLRSDEAVQDFEIQHAESGESGDAEERAGGGRGTLAVLILIVVLAAAGFWWWSGRGDQPPPKVGTTPEQALELPVEDDGFEGRETTESDFGEVPALGASDVWLRQAIATLSAHPALAEWLLNEDLIRSGVRVVSNVAFDEDPRIHMPFLRPTGPFEVEAGDETISARSFSRYDRLAEAFASLDVEGTADLYRSVLPRAEEAFDELGYPGSFDQTLRRALEKLARVPRLESSPRVVRRTLSFHFADPELEQMAPAQKLLLRMGPANAGRIQAQIARLSAALDS